MAIALFIISAIVCAVVFIGDIHSSAQFDEYDDIGEGNKRFRNATGDTNIPKLILSKVIVFVVAFVIAVVVYNLKDGKYYASLVFWAMAIREVFMVIDNYHEIKKSKANLAKEAAAKTATEEAVLTQIDNNNQAEI